MDRLVSVCIAFRNEGKKIAACLDAVLAQDYPHIEIVAADGLSTDESPAIVRDFAERHSRIRLLRNPRIRSDHGFNVAIQNAQGQIIALVGGHTRIAPDFISRSLKVLDETGADVVGPVMNTVGDGYVGEAVAQVLSSPFGTRSKFRYAKTPQFVDTVAFGVYRAELFKEFGLFLTDKPKLEDLEFNRRLVRAGKKIYMHPDIRVDYKCSSTIPGFLRKAWRGGRVVADHFVVRPHSVSLRHLAPTAFVLSILLLAVASAFLPILRLVLVVEICLYAILDLVHSIKATAKRRFRLFPLVLLLFPGLHVSYGLSGLTHIAKTLLAAPFRLARQRAT